MRTKNKRNFQEKDKDYKKDICFLEKITTGKLFPPRMLIAYLFFSEIYYKGSKKLRYRDK